MLAVDEGGALMAGAKRARKDFLEELIEERSARTPEFPRRVQAALHRRELMRALARARQQRGFSQSQVASRMRTSQPAIAKIESGEIDVRASTIDRYAAAIGGRVEYRFVPTRGGRSPQYASA